MSKKPKKYINDILIPDKYAQERYYGKKSRLKENLHYKLIKDLIRLPISGANLKYSSEFKL
ncbi:TPA: alpha-2,3-sialyltransferase [Campylobacter jejuni]